MKSDSDVMSDTASNQVQHTREDETFGLPVRRCARPHYVIDTRRSMYILTPEGERASFAPPLSWHVGPRSPSQDLVRQLVHFFREFFVMDQSVIPLLRSLTDYLITGDWTIDQLRDLYELFRLAGSVVDLVGLDFLLQWLPESGIRFEVRYGHT
ncbi:hypothetical protein R1sor_013882 [Riccia sorocarpa]|uniref:Uncharacterized protein n=1 Tax=Riccia sorocarpa TaxID=122646 RepID=A0ABD3H7U8_9MARC